jgi:putative nucleotidyltransferase with HDIG domain
VSSRRPPRLLVKTVAVAFTTVAMLLAVMFVVVSLSVRNQVRRTVAANLESTQRLFAAVETRRQHELRSQAETLADNATLKAALDTYTAETRANRPTVRADLLETIDRVLEKVAARVDADAIVLVDTHQVALAAAGRTADRWPRGRPIVLSRERVLAAADARAAADGFDGVTRMGDSVFRVVTVPLLLDDAAIGSLYVATNLSQEYAQELDRIAGNRIAIVSDGLVVATTLSVPAARQFESAVAVAKPVDGTIALDRESYAFRRLVSIGDTVFYALGSIDQSSEAAMRDATQSLAVTGALAIGLAALASFWLARLLSEPIGALSTSLAAMAASHDVGRRLPMTGSSRELDTLTETFNTLIASVADAEAQTQSAYTGAIRALATALDARDPYTAGHSDRVSVLSVAICKQLNLPAADIEVVRLGALLHDIGKIGIPDEVLRKPGALTAAEFDIIKQHPMIGARMLRSVPFLAPHIAIVELHHERPDGRGYPKGLRGNDIPLDARIVHVADAYDAITSARAYRGARPSADALRELWRCAGTEFHAEIVAALTNALPGVTSDVGNAVLEHV